MRLDEFGELVSEVYPSGSNYAANLGNAMAETSRYANLINYVGKSPLNSNLMGFRTPTSYLQAIDPQCPKDWTDSSDQMLPYYIALPSRQDEIKQRIKGWGYKTPDTNFVSIPFFCLLFAPWALSLVVFLQALTLGVPISWDQKIAAHLNWFQTALLCPRWIRHFMCEHQLRRAVSTYYAVEPNSGWLIDLYNEAIQKYYS